MYEYLSYGQLRAYITLVIDLLVTSSLNFPTQAVMIDTLIQLCNLLLEKSITC